MVRKSVADREPDARKAVSWGTMNHPIPEAASRPEGSKRPTLPRSAARGLLALGLAAGLLALMPGCIAVVAGAAGAGSAVAYTTGKMTAEVPTSLERTEKATREAIRQLGFAQVSEKADALNAVFICRTALDKRVRIELGRVGDGITRVEIRVGVFGDEPVSQSVLERIKSDLGV